MTDENTQEVVQPETNETEEVVNPQVENQSDVQETQTPTAEQGVTQEQQEEEPKIPYNRFKEVNEEKNYYRKLLEQQLSSQQKPQQDTHQDPYANMDAETAQFWRNVDARAEAKAKAEAEKLRKQYEADRKTYLMNEAERKTNDFRKSHPDVKPESYEEAQIIQKINRGYDIEDAYWAVMGQKGVQRQVKQQVTKTLQQKRQANVETSGGVSPASQTPPKTSWEEHIRKNYDAAVDGKF